MKDVYQFIEDRMEKYKRLRRDIHKHPETAFEEVRTGSIVAEWLENLGIETCRGLAKTGVVGTLKSGNASKAIGLRADMDALDIVEENTFDHKSSIAGKMHGCGHDGHTTMLLAAAEYLSQTRAFDGTVYFIFQPAEENEGGGRVMIEEGLFENFPMDAVFGMHNLPGIDIGSFAVRSGPMMAGFDRFDIEIQGNGGHAGLPHQAVDSIVIAAQIVGALQTLISRTLDPVHSAVLSITKIAAGHTYNVIPDKATLSGTVRYFDAADEDHIENGIKKISTQIASAFGAKTSVDYMRQYPPTINSAAETLFCQEVLTQTFGENRVNTNFAPLMASEDFAFMLQEKPGCYIFTGNGADGPHSCMVHNPHYDFNDQAIAHGAVYWTQLVENALPIR